ncbi:MAG: hypothetical protein ACYTGH_05300 [Planctomycetota bacterium]|jgi:alpha-N-arabinofuranosidase
MTTITLASPTPTGTTAPHDLLGVNLEAAGDTMEGLLSNRLRNPKFRPPAHPDTGIAPEWQPYKRNRTAGVHYVLHRGVYLSGLESQMIDVLSGATDQGILQTGIPIRKGETLVAKLWVCCQHYTTSLRIGIKPMPLPQGDIANAEIEIKVPYWKEYTVELPVDRDDDDAVFYISPTAKGIVWIDQVSLRAKEEGLLRDDTVAAFKSLQPASLRFPGGGAASEYHWRKGIGPRHLRGEEPDAGFRWHLNYDFGTDEYLELCQEMGIVPHISINCSTGTPEEAAEWAAYVAEWYRSRDLPLPKTVFQIGNEQNCDNELGHMTGEMYAQVVRDFAPGLRAAYPGCVLIALGSEIMHGNFGGGTPWRAPLLDQAAECFDALSLHSYATGWKEDEQERVDSMLSGMERRRKEVETLISDLEERGLSHTIAITEWNLWMNAAHHDGGFFEPYTPLHGLYFSGLLNHFIRTGGRVDRTCFYQILNPMGIFVVRGTQFERGLIADLFDLYHPALRGEILKRESESPALESGDPQLDELTLKSENGVYTFLANRSLTESLTLDIQGNYHLLASSGIESTEYGLSEGTVPAGGLVLPPLSIARVETGTDTFKAK